MAICRLPPGSVTASDAGGVRWRREASAREIPAPAGPPLPCPWEADPGERALRLHHGGERGVHRERIQHPDPLLVYPAIRQDFEIGLPGKRLHRGAERTGGRIACEIDCHHHGHT
jgi:hypothetical protein